MCVNILTYKLPGHVFNLVDEVVAVHALVGDAVVRDGGEDDLLKVIHEVPDHVIAFVLTGQGQVADGTLVAELIFGDLAG